MLTYLTAGESHGQAVTAIIEGLPANLKVNLSFINEELSRRQLGFGRGGRMLIEKDKIKVLSGIRDSKTIGSPVSLLIKNKDWPNWSEKMALEKADISEILTTPRPGHADLSGSLKTGVKDLRNILERSSARQTTSLVGIGALAKIFLKTFGIEILSQVISIGAVKAKSHEIDKSLAKKIDNSPVRTLDKEAEEKMIQEIKKAQKEGDTLGGTFQVVVKGVIAGLGGYSIPQKRLDGRLCKAIVSIPAVKGAMVGDIMDCVIQKGSKAHDEIFYKNSEGYYRRSNKAGGIEGGMSNGNDIVLYGYMKPIPTLSKALKTVDMKTKKEANAFKERHDTVAVPAAAVIAESSIALELADVFLEKFGSDNIEDIKANYQNYCKRLKSM